VIRRILHRLPIRVGRWSSEESTRFGECIGAVGYIAVGPFALLFDLPPGLRKPDRVVSLLDLNAQLREVYQRTGRPSPEWIAQLRSD
jgi:hypothetical protein